MSDKFDAKIEEIYKSLMVEAEEVSPEDRTATDQALATASAVAQSHKAKSLARRAGERAAGSPDSEITGIHNKIQKAKKKNLLPRLKAELQRLQTEK